MMAAVPTRSPPDLAVIKKTYIVYPPNAACATCQTDESKANKLMKCGQCKTIRYCNQRCQKADWKRHKRMCQWIKGTRFVDPDGNVTVWKENPNPLPHREMLKQEQSTKD
ncbi:hypothetical protein FRB99_003411 [Tulasnella sp. 403]|nr:hypothetical protein FRB99_003411 [Tulasnella sp. 403]